MQLISDIDIYVSDFVVALRFWSDGLGLEVVEKESTQHTAYAHLEFSDGGPGLRLIAPVTPWAEGERPELGTRPTVRFDIATTTFDETLVRLMESGGQKLGEIESYEGMRTISLADPDGNNFDLIEVPEDAFELADGQPPGPDQ